MKELSAIVIVVMFFVGALVGVVLHGAAIGNDWNTTYATVEQVLQNSYTYKIEHRPYWMRDQNDNGTQVFYTNDIITLKIVKRWDDQQGLEVIAKNLAWVHPYRHKAILVDDSTQTFDAPLVFNSKGDSAYFIRVTDRYGRIIVDTVSTGAVDWYRLIIDPSYLER